MKDLIILSRSLNLYYHFLHNIAKGPSFGEDHALMAEFYAALDSDYDALVERMIGLGGLFQKSDIIEISHESAEILEIMPESEFLSEHFRIALSLEKRYREELDGAMDKASEGTKNMLQGLADASEMRAYKLGQRVK